MYLSCVFGVCLGFYGVLRVGFGRSLGDLVVCFWGEWVLWVGVGIKKFVCELFEIVFMVFGVCLRLI